MWSKRAITLAISTVVMTVGPAAVAEGEGSPCSHCSVAEWSDEDVTGPSGRAAHDMSYDRDRGSVVLFGGQPGGGPYHHDTWEWNGGSWTFITDNGPSSRSNHSMAYNPGGGVVLFGGHDGVNWLGDTWVWDGASWTNETPEPNEDSPAPRATHAMSYDSARGVVVLFGGSDNSTIYGDTWEWDGSVWTEVDSDPAPGARYYHAMAYDSACAEVVLFGGWDGSSHLGDTWTYDGQWEHKTDTGPPSRDEHAMAYLGSRGVVVLFGGSLSDSELFGDSWEWDGYEWREVSIEGPSPRWQHKMVGDSSNGEVMLFGGATLGGAPYSGETWTFNRGAHGCRADLNGDGAVGPMDLAMLLGAWGECSK